jgi:hypothetical protein
VGLLVYLASLGLLLWAVGGLIAAALVTWLGAVVPGRITAPVQGQGKAHPLYVACRYRVGDREHLLVTDLHPRDHPELSDQTEVLVKVLPLLPETRPQLLVPGFNPWSWVGLWLAAGLVNNLWATGFAGAVYADVWRPRRLVCRGQAVVGVVERVTTLAGKGGYSYRVEYCYLVAGATAEQRGCLITAAASDRKAGDPVVVLYDPAHPRHSILYAYAAYEVIGDDPDAFVPSSSRR